MRLLGVFSVQACKDWTGNGTLEAAREYALKGFRSIYERSADGVKLVRLRHLGAASRSRRWLDKGVYRYMVAYAGPEPTDWEVAFRLTDSVDPHSRILPADEPFSLEDV